MKKSLAVLMLATTFSTYAESARKFVTVDSKVFNSVADDLSSSPKVLASNGMTTVIELDLKQIEELSHKIHGKLHRCGGFMAHDSLNEAKGAISNKGKTFNLFNYTVNQQDLVNSIVDQVSEEEIRKTISSLSAFHTRHYNSETGIQSSQFILETWQKLSSHRSDVKVEFFKHTQWSQPSIILTIEGSEKSDEIVVLGGHADSIAMDGVEAPGADDNASGIASITEVLRLLMVNNIKPKRTLQLMAYAAEEVGLLGSKDVARTYRKDGKKVVGVMQLDMTLFKGTAEKDILLISDYTSKAQNSFMGTLIDEYVKVPWGYSRCGYACSDHASWSSMGYQASFPFESSMEEHNPFIHSKADTLESSGGTAEHAVHFTKLGTAFVLEMSK